MLKNIWKGFERIVQVSDTEIMELIRIVHECQHNVCKGTGGSAIATTIQDSSKNKGLKEKFIAYRGNVNYDVFAKKLNGENFAD